MKVLYSILIFILILGVWSSTAQAGPWDLLHGIRLSPEKVNSPNQTWEVAPPPSPQTYAGKLTNFTVVFDDRNQNFDCRASLTSDDGRQFSVRFNAVPSVQEEVFSLFYLAQQAALCQSAQRAYLGDQRISVTGLLDASSNQGGQGLPTIAVQRFAPLPPEGESQFGPASSRPEYANVCNLGVCNAEGAMVTSVTYNLGSFPILCSAVLMVPQDGVNRMATLQIDTPEIAKEPCIDVPQQKLLNAKFQGCLILEAAMDSGQPVQVLGYGQGSNFSVASVEMVNDPLPSTGTEP